MGPGFKYHIVTVAAIFFALTVGLVVGSLFVSPRLVDRQTRTLSTLQKTLDSDLNDKTQQLERYEKCLATIMPAYLKGRLSGKSVVLIQTGDYPDTTRAVRAALLLADAHVRQLTIAPNFDRPDDVLNPALAGLNADNPRLPADRDALADMIAGLAARGDSATDGLLPLLEQENYVRLENGDDYTTPARYVILIAGSRSDTSQRTDNVDRPLVAALLKHGVTVVACEPQEAVVSDMKAFHSKQADIATVDNADTDIGQCVLIYALRGDKDAYGVKPGAKLIPPQMAQSLTP